MHMYICSSVVLTLDISPKHSFLLYASSSMPNFTEPKDWRHHTAWVDTEARLHYVEVTPNEPNDMAIVLIHGYPETWYAFRHIMQPLADSGFRVIAVDYRGAGDSNHPAGGYDKKTMARDIFTLYHDKLGIESAIIFGYDIGSMVAVSLAMQYEDHVQALISCGECLATRSISFIEAHGMAEAPIPGTTAFEQITNDHSTKWSRVFHYFFHSCPDLPEALTQGRERMYLKHFYERLVGPRRCSNGLPCLSQPVLRPVFYDAGRREYLCVGMTLLCVRDHC